MDREDRLKIGIVLAVFAADVVGFIALGLRFDWASTLKVAAAWPLLMVLGWFYATRRVDPPVSHLMRETAHLAAFCAVAAMLSYLVTASNLPLIDPWLVKADRLLGFDWPSYVTFVNEHPWLGQASSLFYISTLPQVAAAAILLPVLGLTERARELVLAVMIAGLIAIAISGILPAAGALAFYHPDPSFIAPNAPMVDLAYKDEFFRMRALELPVLSLENPKGLIAFPSYHVALSVLIALSFRSRPLFFVPLAVLNFFVILSTPIDGGHHLIDGISGAVVSFVSLWLAINIRRKLAAPATQQSVSAGGVPGIVPPA